MSLERYLNERERKKDQIERKREKGREREKEREEDRLCGGVVSAHTGMD